MCAVPTSGGDEFASFVPLGGDWREADAAWEAEQYQAAVAAKAGDLSSAAVHWAAALRLARAEFATNDPRLATSLANHAHAARYNGREAEAAALFDEALRVWDSSGPWIEALRPERRARSSLFHLRLESKHPGGYEHHARTRYRALAAEGRATLAALRDGPTAAPARDARLAHWEQERQAGYGDARKLTAAALLLA